MRRRFPARGAALLALALSLAACSASEGDPVAAGYRAQNAGYAALGRQDYGAAFEDFRTAEKWVPDDPYVQLNLGVAAQHLGRLDAARAAFRKAETLGVHAMPHGVTDPRYQGLTVAELAKANLAALDKPEPKKPEEKK